MTLSLMFQHQTCSRDTMVSESPDLEAHHSESLSEKGSADSYGSSDVTPGWYDAGLGVVLTICDGVVGLQFSIRYPWLWKIWLKTYPWLGTISLLLKLFFCYFNQF